VAFVSVSEQMDFTTPMGKMFPAMLGALAQYYSDNLGHETKKGKHERKRQGLFNGVVPFGLKKGPDGLPVPDPETYPGLLLAFKAAAEGKSDREVAVLLNQAGYRSTGNRGPNPFRKDSVRGILTNRFYLGNLPDGTEGWIPAKHAAVLDPERFEATQAARAMHSRHRHSVPMPTRTYSLSGQAICGHCGGRLHLHSKSDRPRIY
jgi:site-specific DNA recombinase